MKARFLILVFALVIMVHPYGLLANDCGGPILQLGWFTAKQGKSQHVNIEGLIGDDFSVDKSSDQNVLIGAGYYFDFLDTDEANILYGINAFYLPPTKVAGKVTQENLFTNLSYRYFITHYPLYFASRALIHCCENSDLVIDLGIGLNIINAKDFKERSLDGITIPDAHLFSGKTNATFSATAGFGWRIYVMENLSLEIDYRFFYLGKGELKKNNSQLKNTLHTGQCYANALFLSISL